MGALKVHSVDGKGKLSEECVWLSVSADIPSLSYFLLCDTTYLDEGHISNELRHMYWFKPKAVKEGDWIRVYTKNGTNTSVVNDKKTTTHIFYWNLGATVWNKDGDAAILFDLTTWKSTKV